MSGADWEPPDARWVPWPVMAGLLTPHEIWDPFVVDPQDPPSAVELLAGVRFPSDGHVRRLRLRPDVHFAAPLLGDWMQHEGKP